MAKLSPIVKVSIEPYIPLLKSEHVDKRGRKFVLHYDSLSLLFHNEYALKNLDRITLESLQEVPNVPVRQRKIDDDILLNSDVSRRLQNPADVMHHMMRTAKSKSKYVADCQQQEAEKRAKVESPKTNGDKTNGKVESPKTNVDD